MYTKAQTNLKKYPNQTYDRVDGPSKDPTTGEVIHKHKVMLKISRSICFLGCIDDSHSHQIVFIPTTFPSHNLSLTIKSHSV